MKTCFSTLSCPDWSWDHVVDEAARLGFDGFEPRVVDGGLDLVLEWEKKWQPDLAEPEVAFPHYISFTTSLMKDLGLSRRTETGA